MSTHDTSARALFRVLARMLNEQPHHGAAQGLRYAVGHLAGLALHEAHQAGDIDGMARASRTLDALDGLPTNAEVLALYDAQLQAAAQADREAFAARIRAWEAQDAPDGPQEPPARL